MDGPVASVAGSSLVVRGITVNTDSSTVIKKQGKSIAFSDIKPGDSVEAHGTRVDDHTMLPKQIEVGGSDDGD